jgi:hypothetical protein
MRASIVLGIALAAAVAAPAHAQTAKISQQMIDPNGDPLVVAFAAPDGAQGDVTGWRICRDGVTCEDAAVTSTGPHSLDVFKPGETAPGSVFEVVVNDRGGHVTTARTTPWQGRVTSTAPPSLTGDVAVGGMVRPVAGTWSGGWGNDADGLGVIACKTPAREGCRTLSFYKYSLPGAAAIVDATDAGCYLFAFDQRFEANPIMTNEWADPRSVPAPQPAQTLSLSAPAGQVPGGDCSPVPPSSLRTQLTPAGAVSAVIRRRALRERGRIVIGRVRCEATCRVQLSVSDGRRTVKRSLKARGSQELAILRRLRPGTLKVRVMVDGRTVAGGRTRLAR